MAQTQEPNLMPLCQLDPSRHKGILGGIFGGKLISRYLISRALYRFFVTLHQLLVGKLFPNEGKLHQRTVGFFCVFVHGVLRLRFLSTRP